MSTSLTSCACRPARETAALIAALPSCGAVSGAKAPWKPAMAVRAMPTMTIGSSADAAMAQSPAVWLLGFPAPWSTGPYTWSTWARRPTGTVRPQPCQTQKGPDLAERLSSGAQRLDTAGPAAPAPPHPPERRWTSRPRVIFAEPQRIDGLTLTGAFRSWGWRGPRRRSALLGLHPLALRNIDDLHTAIFGSERVFGVLQVLGTHALSHQPFRADPKLPDQIKTH